LFLTAGADVQRGGASSPGRIEVEIVAWGRGGESWSIDYRIFEGNPAEREVWTNLDKLLDETFLHESGARIPISRLFIDSGDGLTTNDVYLWARSKQPTDRVWAIKGVERGALPVGQPSAVDVSIVGRKVTGGLRIKTVHSGFFKAELYSSLKLRAPTDDERAMGLGFPPKYCHFPAGRNYGDEHFMQLTAEELQRRIDRRTKRARFEWVKTRPRNEALDCRVYARAAAWDYGMDQAQEEHWKALEEMLTGKQLPAPSAPVSQTEIETLESHGRDVSSWRDPDQSGRWIERKHWFRR
jgi:phage terminase large subunit GpA-like protein